MSRPVKMFVYTLCGAAIGFVASVLFVWFFVDMDMVLIFYIIGPILGAVAGIVAARVVPRRRRARAA